MKRILSLTIQFLDTTIVGTIKASYAETMLDLFLLAAVALACAPIVRSLLSRYRKGAESVSEQPVSEVKIVEKQDGESWGL